MKAILFSLIAAGALALTSQAADVTTTITDIHMCCGSCVKGAQETVAKIPGAKCVASKDDENAVVSGPDKATVQKAVDALIAAGFYGKSSNPDIKIMAMTGAKNEKVKMADVSGVHICCGSCVKALDKLVKGVPGVESVSGIAKNAASFHVMGDFNEKDLMDALQKDGFTGKISAGGGMGGM